MTNAYEVTILSTREVHTLPGIWDDGSLRRVLTLAEFDDADRIDQSEVHDMALMALQDLGNQAAGEKVLEAVFGDAMRPGVRQNLVDDLQEDQPWADFADVAQQRGIFIAVVLLQKAFPNRYGTPDAIQLRASVRALADAGVAPMTAATPAWLIRVLACGMSGSDILIRLYEDELPAGAFSDAPGIVWHCEAVESGGDGGNGERTRTFELISSRHWFGPLSAGQSFRATVP